VTNTVAESLRIHVDDGTSVTATVNRPQECKSGQTPGLILAHGAANDLNHPLLKAVAEGLADRRTAIVIRFNFPHRERGASSPSSMDSLAAAYRRVHDTLADYEACTPGPIFMGGKSLGAKVAAELVSRHHEGEGLLGECDLQRPPGLRTQTRALFLLQRLIQGGQHAGLVLGKTPTQGKIVGGVVGAEECPAHLGGVYQLP